MHCFSSIRLIYISLLCLFLFDGTTVFAQNATTRTQGKTTQLVVDGKPFIILGGELGNSSASCNEDIERIFPKLKRMGLNTVLTPMYWDLFEPEEGKFDFSLTDKVLDEARNNDLKVVFLWFGAWKNSMSCYAPEWFKADSKRFPRAHTKTGKPLEIASAFSENVFKADNKAFTAWLNHLKEADGKSGTVIMIQIENEIGMLEDARDYSPDATKLYNSAVPADLVSFIQKNKNNLHPWMTEKLSSAKTIPSKGKTSWTQLFGDDIYTEEIFSAYHYAKYVERMAQTAKKVFDVPLYVNAALNSRGRKPGQYPAAGPLAHLKDVWHCAAPSLTCLSPDIYDTGFKDWVEQYALTDNPLFIPEIKRGDENGAQAFYILGEKDAIGISPFSIEDGSDKPTSKTVMAYNCLKELTPLITKYQGKGVMNGLYFSNDDKERILNQDGMKITCRHFFTLPWDARATEGSRWCETGAILIKIAPYEYILAGTGVVVQFENEGEKLIQKTLGEDGFAADGASSSSDNMKWSGCPRIGIAYCDQVSVNQDGALKFLRRLNGDQDHQGRHVRIGVDDFQILHIKLYQYK